MKEFSIQEFEQLISEFSKQPKTVINSTYLELCKYPGARFEEICSRLLHFLLSPTNEHGFSNLFLKSLLKILPNTEFIAYLDHEIQVWKEVNANGKRLDLLINGPDFVIGIENKIFASVYNPLESYAELVGGHNKEKTFKIVLTAKPIVSNYELELIQKSGFTIIYFKDYFAQVKKNIGDYICAENQNYLFLIYDFIKTIENMTGETNNNNQLSLFFSKNSEKIDNLIELYNKYNERILNIQKEAISELLKRIKNVTRDPNWWEYEGWDLGYHTGHIHFNKPKLGLESSFELYNNDPLGMFSIYITTWNLEDFIPYEKKVLELFSGKFIDKKNGRVQVLIDVVRENNLDTIIAKLKEYYYIFQQIVKESII